MASASCCECDVQASLEHHPVILHDDTLDRTTSGVGPVCRPLSELASLRLRDSHGRLTDEPLPTLAAVLEIMPAGKWLLIELKSGDDAMLAEVASLTAGRRCRFQSFDIKTLRALRRRVEPDRLAVLVEDAAALQAAIRDDWPAVNMLHSLLNEATAAELAAAGKSIGVWTVNSPADIRRSVALGAEWIITDDPLGAGAVL